MDTRPKREITDQGLDEMIAYYDEMANTPGVSAPLTGHYRRTWFLLVELKERRQTAKAG